MKPIIETDCTISLNGKNFTAGGAVITDTRLVAYPGSNGILNDWHGNQIGTYTVISSRKAVFFGHRSWIGDRFYFMRARLTDGRSYSLRGFGEGMSATGRRVK